MRNSFWSRLVQDGECWTWIGRRDRDGYGRFGRSGKAHRIAYEFMVGPIPEDLELDHLCRNRACANPDHLDPVSHRVNRQRGRNAMSERTHCPRGHAYDTGNTYRDPQGKRSCLTCRRAANRERMRAVRMRARNA